jgi:hypothetical protein
MKEFNKLETKNGKGSNGKKAGEHLGKYLHADSSFW